MREREVDGGGGGGGRGGEVHRVQRNERTAAAVADSDSFEPESKSAEQRKEKRSRKNGFFAKIEKKRRNQVFGRWLSVKDRLFSLTKVSGRAVSLFGGK